YLINEKREALRALEDKSRVQIVVVPNPHMQTPEYSIRRVREDEAQLSENAQVSYQIPVAPSAPDVSEREKKPPGEQPAVAAVLPRPPAPLAVAGGGPTREEAESGGFWQRVKRWFGADGVPAPEVSAPAPAPRVEPQAAHTERQPSRGRDRRGPRRERH